jgi:F-type H+-transporting ATPase subunit gamma
MASSKELRIRIKSIKNTSKVTKAMELVSAAKMRKAQQMAVNGRSYAELTNKVLQNIASGIDPAAHPLLNSSENDTEAVLLITTNRGLCGALNSNLFKKALGFSEKVAFISLGKKGQVFVTNSGKNLAADFELLQNPSLDLARTLAKFLTDSFLSKEFNKISVVYTSFQNTLRQEARIRQILPIIDLDILQNSLDKTDFTSDKYLFEPSAKQVLNTILPHYILMEIYQILLEASASEHSARMVAMKNASDNALELVDDLTLAYNQLRQANITNEILDIATAAIALN